MRKIYILLLAVLGASGQWTASVVGVPITTNQVTLTWISLGAGTQYFVQSSVDFWAWTTATNTTATNVNLSFIGDRARTFRLSVTNMPAPSATLAWEPSDSSADIAGYFIYYGANSRSYTNRVDVGLATSGVVTNLLVGVTYYFAVTAYSSSGLESDYSSEVVWQRQLSLGMKILQLP